MKFGLLVLLASSLVLTASVAVVVERMRREAAAESEAVTRKISAHVTGAVQSTFDGALAIVDKTNDDFMAMKAAGVAQPIVYDILLHRMVEGGGDQYGAWFAWTKDGSPTRKTNDDTYATYWHQNGMDFVKDAVPQEILDSALFKTPLDKGESVLLEPHAIDARNGDPTLVTSFARVLGDADHRYGVLAIDTKLDAIADAVAGLGLPVGGAYTVVSDGGVIALSSVKSRIGRPMEKAAPELMATLVKARLRPGSDLRIGFDGARTLRSWSAIQFNGVVRPWYLVLDVPEVSLVATVSKDKAFLLAVPVIALLAILICVLVAMDLVVSRPLKALSLMIVGLGDGLFAYDVPWRSRKDEVGDIARAVHRLQDSGLEIARLREASGESEYQRQLQRRSDLDRISAVFSQKFASLVHAIEEVAATVGDNSRQVSDMSTIARKRLDDIASASRFAKGSMVSVTTSTMFLLGTIDSIGEQTRHGRDAARDVERSVVSTDTSIRALRRTMDDIDGVSKAIDAVASQINMIALNATIEAARAGEAGRGFAVVAQEIKTLAAQTAKATSQISLQIGAVRNASGHADGEVDGMRQALNALTTNAKAIMGALEAQSGATDEIRGLVDNALARADGVDGDMETLIDSADRIDGAATVMLEQSASLSERISNLGAEVGDFLRFLKAA